MKVPRFVLSIWNWGVPWVEWGGDLLRDYFLLIVGSCVILGAIVIKWVQFPFSANLSGIRLSLLHDPGAVPHISLFSVGVLSALILFFALLFLRKSYALLGLAAALLLTLWIITPSQLAFQQPTILRRLSYELQVTPVWTVFDKEYLEQNYGMAELVPKRIVLYTAWGRLLAAWSFMRLGWYLFGLGALLLFFYAIGKLTGTRLSTIATLLALPLAALLITLIAPAIGQHYYSEGLLAKSEGRNQEAISDFRSAMRWDSWHSADEDLYATIGQLQKQAGVDFNSPERHMRRAVEFRDASEYESAIFEFSRAAEAKGAIGEVARRELAATRATYGIALYRSGAVGSAVTNWAQALAEDSNQIYILPYLTRGYYELGRYQDGIDTGLNLAKLIRDHKFAVANIYSMVGDCYAKMGDDAQARHYYALSLEYDPILNYWAVTGLAGE